PPAVYALWSGGYQCIPIGAEAGALRILRMADLTRPKVLIGTPSLVEHLAERAREAIKKEVRDLGIEVILVAGEPGGGLPEFRAKMMELYGARVYDAQFGVFGTVNISCPGVDYHGLHELAPDLHVRAEDLRDPETGGPVEIVDGAQGEYLYTALVHEARPALKWRPGDLAEVFTEPCVCGFRGIRYRLLGRVDDMLIVKGVNVFPSAIKAVVERFFPRTTGHFRIMLVSRSPRVTPPLRLRVEFGDGVREEERGGLAAALADEMHHRLKIRPEIALIPAGTLPRSEQKSRLIEYPDEGRRGV
ncbi:MAG: phenylacetate--CoA ligase family protein, partial [Candidatus Rokubacteria bacterium]|nr:phenylacetate--CoA ligase family protein [Candidatus Rokubacteria bacterium]